MQIPIQNIYYLLCYAWNKLEEKDIVEVEAEETDQWPDLFAKVLINGAAYLFKKGLDRDYRDAEDDSCRIKGKLLFDPSLKKMLFQSARAHCRYDELSHNVLHNQILKTTIRQLTRCESLDRELRNHLNILHQRFPLVDEIELEAHHFRKVKLHRNNFFYDFLLKVCEIIYDNLFVSEEPGCYKFRDFLRDERQMRQLFEAFVRNFYKKEQNVYRVSKERIDWTRERSGAFDSYMPGMETDISLGAKDDSRKIVIETKYIAKGFKVSAQYGESEKLRADHLYQLYAYLKNLEAKGGANERCEGILLYAAVDEEADLRFYLPGHPVRVRTLSLNQDWRKIRADLLALVA